MIFLKGFQSTFTAKKIFGRYIVAFNCAAAKLAIEIDGSQHYNPNGIVSDTIREKYLHSLGLTLKRYTNSEINEDFESVCKDIYHFIYPEDK